jgi:hypothetical protein
MMFRSFCKYITKSKSKGKVSGRVIGQIALNEWHTLQPAISLKINFPRRARCVCYVKLEIPTGVGSMAGLEWTAAALTKPS